jgi:beta-lactamase class A
MEELGLKQTVLVGDSLDALLMLPQDLDYSITELLENFPRIPPEQMKRWRALYPEHTNRSTPREMTTLLRMIAQDEAGPPEACEEVRRIMSLQVWPHRLRSGFGDDVRVWAKIGTLPGIRNEVGVVELPDGGRYAIAIFTRTSSLTEREPDVDRVIGRAAARAVEALRAR